MSISVLHSAGSCPAWLVRADELMKAAGYAGITNVWQLLPPLGSAARPLAHRAMGPVGFLEGRSYNPARRDALAVTPGIHGAEQQIVAGADQLAAAIAAQRPDIVLCEGDCPVEALRSAAVSTGCRIWVLNECWSDLLPTHYARCWLEQVGVVETTLTEIFADGTRRTLLRTRSQVPSVSLSLGMHRYFWKLAHLPLRALQGRVAAEPAMAGGTQRLTATELVRISSAQVGRRFRSHWHGRNDTAWTLAIGPAPDDAPLPASFRKFMPIVPPADRFWADPFIVWQDDRHFLFFEELLAGKEHGHIVVAEIGPEGLRSEPVIALEMPWHLSYPHVFNIDGVWYMVPESGAKGRVDLYRADAFPYGWRHERTLLADIHAYDATLLQHDQRWWMFSTVTDGQGISAHDELWIHYTDDPLHGRWLPHARNPVVSDVTCARPAGAFLRSGGRLYRPAQDSRNHYGYGLVLHEVEALTPDIYRERAVRRVTPGGDDTPHWQGLHTYNACRGIAVVDYLR